MGGRTRVVAVGWANGDERQRERQREAAQADREAKGGVGAVAQLRGLQTWTRGD